MVSNGPPTKPTWLLNGKARSRSRYQVHVFPKSPKLEKWRRLGADKDHGFHMQMWLKRVNNEKKHMNGVWNGME